VNGPPATHWLARDTAPVLPGKTAAEDPPASEGYRARIGGWLESLASGFSDSKAPVPASEDKPGLIDLMGRSLDTMQAQIARMQLALDPPDLLIRMPRDRCAFYEFWRARELIDLGRESTLAALQAWETRGSER
jgi:NTE family protein